MVNCLPGLAGRHWPCDGPIWFRPVPSERYYKDLSLIISRRISISMFSGSNFRLNTTGLVASEYGKLSSEFSGSPFVLRYSNLIQNSATWKISQRSFTYYFKKNFYLNVFWLKFPFKHDRSSRVRMLYSRVKCNQLISWEIYIHEELVYIYTQYIYGTVEWNAISWLVE